MNIELKGEEAALLLEFAAECDASERGYHQGLEAAKVIYAKQLSKRKSHATEQHPRPVEHAAPATSDAGTAAADAATGSSAASRQRDSAGPRSASGRQWNGQSPATPS